MFWFIKTSKSVCYFYRFSGNIKAVRMEVLDWKTACSMLELPFISTPSHGWHRITWQFSGELARYLLSQNIKRALLFRCVIITPGILHTKHNSDVIMSAMASQITSLTIVYSTVYSGTDQRKLLVSALHAFVMGIYRSPVNSPHEGPVTRKKVSIWWRHHVNKGFERRPLLLTWINLSPNMNK